MPTRIAGTDTGGLPTRISSPNTGGTKLIDTYRKLRTYFVHSDHLGSSSVLTDSHGEISEVADYYPYGSLRIDNQPGKHATSYKFTGKELDSSGLYYYGARYYDPEIGRFTQIDPLQIDPKRLLNPQGLNLYGYALNNPLRYLDPEGTSWWDAVKSAAWSVAQAVVDFTVEVIEEVVQNQSVLGTYENTEYNYSIAAIAGKLAGDTISLGISVAEEAVGVMGMVTGATGTGLSLATVPATGPAGVAGAAASAGLATAGAGMVLHGYAAAVEAMKQGYMTMKELKEYGMKSQGTTGRHTGFIKNLSEMKDNQIKKTIRSLERRINEHLENINSGKSPKTVPHWRGEIKTWREQSDLAIKEAKKRGLKIE